MIEVRALAGRADQRAFIRLPWRIYAGDPAWVPPLMHDVKKVMDRKHPFHRHADVEYFLARRNGEVVGRIAAIHNRAHVEFHEEPCGFFGLFECIDDVEVARALLKTAEQWVAERGMRIIRGPVNLSTNDELYSPGVVIDGFEKRPAIMMAHTPPYYVRLLETAGYSKAKDLLSIWLDLPVPPPRFVRGSERLKKRERVEIRPIDLKQFEREVRIVQDIYNEAWEKNWGFVPMTEAEIQNLAMQLRPVVVPDLVLIAEVDGEPVGFALGLPDYNQALAKVNGRLFPFGVAKLLWHKRNIKAIRVITLGLKPGYRHRGLDAMLILHLVLGAAPRGYPRGECSWILEDNWEMRRGLERLGGEVYRTYRVYERALIA